MHCCRGRRHAAHLVRLFEVMADLEKRQRSVDLLVLLLPHATINAAAVQMVTWHINALSIFDNHRDLQAACQIDLRYKYFQLPSCSHVLILASSPNIVRPRSKHVLTGVSWLVQHPTVTAAASCIVTFRTHSVHNMSALHAAAREDPAKCAQILAQGQCDVNARDRHARTPLHLAAWAGQARPCALYKP